MPFIQALLYTNVCLLSKAKVVTRLCSSILEEYSFHCTGAHAPGAHALHTHTQSLRKSGLPLALLGLCDVCCDRNAPDALGIELLRCRLSSLLIDIDNCHCCTGLSQSVCKGPSNALASACKSAQEYFERALQVCNTKTYM